MGSGQLQDATRKFSGGNAPKVAFDCRAQVGRAFRDTRDFGRETNCSAAPLGIGFEPNSFAAELDLSSDSPRFRGFALLSLAQKLLFQPGDMFLGEAFGFSFGAATRNRDSRDAMTSDAKDVAPGQVITDEFQGQPMLGYKQPITAWLS